MSEIEKTVGIVKDFIDANPEATKEVSKSLVTITKSINVALLPLSGLVWGYEKIAAWLEPKLAEKLEDVPQENIIAPPINIAGPTIEAMRFTGDNDVLREMYANLLASAMNKDTVYKTHPRFVDIIKNITSEEAILLRFLNDAQKGDDIIQLFIIDKSSEKTFSYYLLGDKLIEELMGVSKELVKISMDNLISLGLYLHSPFGSPPVAEYTKIELITKYPNLQNKLEIDFEHCDQFVVTFLDFIITEVGVSFINSVVEPR